MCVYIPRTLTVSLCSLSLSALWLSLCKRKHKNLWFFSFVGVFVLLVTDMEAAAREHVEEIRRKKFSIGGEQNPLTEDLHQAVKNLSAELYAKDVHFLMELIQVTFSNSFFLTFLIMYVCFCVFLLWVLNDIYVWVTIITILTEYVHDFTILTGQKISASPFAFFSYFFYRRSKKLLLLLF